jgi:hypothetical protein
MPLEAPAPAASPAMARLRAALSALETEAGRMAGINFVPRAGDVFIATPPKCGTTLLQAIVHSLRSGGDMTFDEISLVIPCLEMAVDYGYGDLQAAQPGAPPRAFKTHFWRPHCPTAPGARHIVVLRDPLDAGPSFYDFMAGWFFPRGAIGIDEFLTGLYLSRGAPASPMHNASYWHFLASWWPARADPSVLLLFYEDLVEDLPRGVKLVADFLGPAAGAGDAAAQALAVEQASMEHMRAHASKFDEHMLKAARNAACGLPPGAGGPASGAAGKVHVGGAGRGAARLSAVTRAAMGARWAEVALPATGHASYAALRREANAELGQRFGGGGAA